MGSILFSLSGQETLAASSSGRSSFLRGETIVWSVTAEPMAEVEVSVAGLYRRKVQADAEGKAQLELETVAFRPGSYEVVVQSGGRVLESRRISVAPPLPREGIPLYRWGHVTEAMNFDWYRDRGFTGGTAWVMTDPEEPGSKVYERRKKLLERATEKGFAIGFYLHPLWSKRVVGNDEARVLMKNGQRVDAKVPWPVDPLTTVAQQHADAVVDSFIRSYSEYPVVRYCMLSSEQRPLPGVGKELMELAARELPFDFSTILEEARPGFRKVRPVRGVIRDDDPDYLGRKWFHERGHGTNLLDERMAVRLRQVRPDLKFSHEPWRNAPTRDTARGLDLIGSWTYSYSDMKRLMFAHFLRAPGRAEGQKIQPILSLYVYANMVMPLQNSRADMNADNPAGDPFFTAGPDYATEGLWIYLSLRPEEISVYWAGALSPDNPALDPRISSPETFDAIHAFVRDVMRPFGPAILKSGRPTAPVGLLASAAGAWFTDKELGYNVNEAALPYASLLVMNDVPFDLLLDNDIQEGGLRNYRALVIAYGSTLTQKMADEIVAFAKRGGTVISNEPLPLKIPNLVVTNFDFEPLLRQDGRPRKDGKPMVTADEAREMMERYAAELAPRVKAFRGPVTSPSKRVIINSLDAHGGRYDFVINDDRTYGPRFGEHRLHFELGVPQTAEVAFDASAYPVLYDLLARKPLADLRSNGGKPLALELPPASGRIILALPEAVDRVEVQGPAELERGKPVCVRVQVIGASGKVMKHAHPLQVRILDGKGEETGWSRYTAAFDGVAEVTFTPAWNDAAGEWTIEVTDLAAGKTCHIHPKLN